MKNRYEVRGEVTVIFLNRKDGTVIETLIDTSDLPLVSTLHGTWYAEAHRRDGFYVKGEFPNPETKRKQRGVYLHRLLLNVEPSKVTDHINHDTLDNRKSNLRNVTIAENNQNLNGAKKNNKSCTVLGVSFNKSRSRWRSRITQNGKNLWEREYKTLEEAELAIKEARKTYLPYSQEALLY